MTPLTALSGLSARIFQPISRPQGLLLLLRAGFFGLLAYDLAVPCLGHAPRYGAGLINVPQLPWMSLFFPAPSAAALSALYLSGALLSGLIALGLLGRRAVAALAMIYGVAYLWSQADSYQHHYLIALLLVLVAAYPWRALPERHWVLKALCVQLGLLYLWSGIAKLEPIWLEGQVVEGMLRAPHMSEDVAALRALSGLELPALAQLLAVGACVGEFLAALIFFIPRLHPIGLFLIPPFHIGVEWIGLDIEVFSYYMLLLNLCLLCPPKLWALLTRPLSALPVAQLWPKMTAQAAGEGAQQEQGVDSGSGSSPSLGRCLTLAALCGLPALWSPFEGALLSAALIALSLALSIDRHGNTWSLLRWVAPLASVLMIFSLRASELPFEYYRMWGGDLRRRGMLEESLARYEEANRYTAGPGRLHSAAELLLRLRPDEPAARARAVALLEESRRRQERALQAAEHTLAALTEEEGEAAVAQSAILLDEQLRLAARCRSLLPLQRGEAREHSRRCIEGLRVAVPSTVASLREAGRGLSYAQRSGLRRLMGR